MKRFLRALLNWLDLKFPDKVIITPEKFLGFQNDHSNLVREQDRINVRLVLQADEISQNNRRFDLLTDRVAALKQDDRPLRELDEKMKEKMIAIDAKLLEMQNEINKFNIAMGFMPLGLTKSAQDVAATLQR